MEEELKWEKSLKWKTGYLWDTALCDQFPANLLAVAFLLLLYGHD